MSAKQKLTTTISIKGRVFLPQSIREQRRWSAGTELLVEDVPNGVLLKAKPVFAPTRPEDVFGSLRHSRRARLVVEMEAGTATEAKQRHVADDTNLVIR